MTVGILGMAFKAESDDTRESLGYKLVTSYCLRAQGVLCTDPYIDDELLGRWTMCSRTPTSSSSRRPTGSTPAWRLSCRSSTGAVELTGRGVLV